MGSAHIAGHHLCIVAACQRLGRPPVCDERVPARADSACCSPQTQSVMQVVAAREGLPITGMEQEIMELIGQHDIVVLCGETGCGKTTQARPFAV